MEVTSVNCNNCGAPLEVGPGTNYVTCRHCGSRLAVKRTASTAYTELLGELDRKTDAIAEKVEVLLQQNELERIDREWEEERRRYLSTDKHGATREPSVVEGIMTAAVGGFLGIVMAVVILAAAYSWGEPRGFTTGGIEVPEPPTEARPGGPPPGLACIGFAVALGAVGLGMYTVRKARRFEEARARYRQRRAAAAALGTSPDRTPG